MSRADRYDFTLDEETEKRLYDLLTDIDTRRTNIFWVKDKRGYHAEYVKVIRCKDCKYSVEEYNDGECYCDYNRELRYIKDWNHYCGWAERNEE